MERQQVTALAALDLSAAFDTVDHGVLVKLLNSKFGLSGNALLWFKTYLSPRSAEVHINKSRSQPRALNFSVPQGSICGPVLYTAYASTLQEYINSSGINLLGYADDHTAYDSFSANNLESAHIIIKNLEKTLVDINDWMNLNRLKLNPTKTEFILFGSKNQLAKCDTESLQVVNSTVEKSSVIKYLGCNMDDQLNFKEFISSKCRTISYNLLQIKQIRSYLTFESCVQLVQSLITSHLDYANSVLYGTPEVTIRRLQILQNRAAKLVLRLQHRDSSTKALKKLHWLPVRCRVNFKIACIVYKCLNDGDSPEYLKQMLQIRNSNYNIRSISTEAKTLVVPSVKRKTFASRSFAVSGPEVWNSLPVSIRNICDFKSFKRKLKTHYFTLAFH